MNISIISTCKSRLDYLRQVIPSWLAFQPFEIIVVDVACPQGTKDWLRQNHPSVKVVTHDREGFNIAEARNIGAKVAMGDFLFFVDADIMLGSGFHPWIKQFYPENAFLVRHRNSPYEGTHEQGTVLCKKADFVKIQGYDETFEGYGGEDHDFYDKLLRAGVRRLTAPQKFISTLEHDDGSRTLHYKIKDKKAQSVINRTYSAAKSIILSANPGVTELPSQTRKELWKRCHRILGSDFEKMHQSTELEVRLNLQKWLPEPYFLEANFILKLKVRMK